VIARPTGEVESRPGRHGAGWRRGIIDDDGFAASMACLEPFETAPHLAVAVSGGADSMALCLLARAWAVRRGGRVTALTVDHALRPESAEEACRVAAWLRPLGIAHVALRRRGPAPASRLQERARDVRYALMSEWCREAGVFHLLLGHHRGDQAETVLMRLMRGSGSAGLAGMAPIVEMPWGRLLRPLLDVAPADLRQFLVARGQRWIEDPSNRDPRFERGRLRRLLPELRAGGAIAARLGDVAQRAADRRDLLGEAVDALHAGACSLAPSGYATVDLPALRAAPAAVGSALVRRLVTMIGGLAHPAPPAGAARVWREIVIDATRAGATFGRCRMDVVGDRLLICREQRNMPPPRSVAPGAWLHWDGRFLIEVAGDDTVAAPLMVTALGEDGWRWVAARTPAPRPRRLLAAAMCALPALADAEGLVHVPHLRFRRSTARRSLSTVLFWPRASGGAAAPFLAADDSHIM
jgi:tRNA(Ile)-lysidine synthase